MGSWQKPARKLALLLSLRPVSQLPRARSNKEALPEVFQRLAAQNRAYSSAVRPLSVITAIAPSVSRNHPELGDAIQEEAEVGGEEVTFETGKLARLASGAVVASLGNTRVLATAVSSHELDASKDFLPLQVDYREKQYAAGKIPATFMRREGAPKEREILCGRVIDRSIRPLFPKGFYFDTQVSASVLCSDGELDPDILCINAASAALMISDIPWGGPIGAVRLARINGAYVVNPSVAQLEKSDLNLAVKLIEPQLCLAAKVSHRKRAVTTVSVDPEVYERIHARAFAAVQSVLTNPSYGKSERGQALSQVEQELKEEMEERDEKHLLPQLRLALERMKREVIKTAIFGSGERVDGRGLNDVRQVHCQAGYLPALHGSSLFSRGNTQRLDSLVGPHQKRFMVHYSFPGFSINEVRPERGGLNRREDFPYSVRITSEVLGSDGSSSMATVCGGSLALMDAGIKLRKHVAGVSMGLVTELHPETREVADYRLVTDILGLEDYLGDMDFKIAGTRDGITAIQLDIKLPGVPLHILCEGLEPARAARAHILDLMEAEISAPRNEHHEYSPRIGTINIEKDSIGRLIGPQGTVIKGIQKATSARLTVSEDGVVSIFARDFAAFEAAKELGVVAAVKDFGAFVEIDGGVSRVEDEVAVGESLTVVCIGRDFRGNPQRLLSCGLLPLLLLHLLPVFLLALFPLLLALLAPLFASLFLLVIVVAAVVVSRVVKSPLPLEPGQQRQRPRVRVLPPGGGCRVLLYSGRSLAGPGRLWRFLSRQLAAPGSGRQEGRGGGQHRRQQQQ
eukprot:jgi/Mesen1/8828/ME000053S08231